MGGAVKAIGHAAADPIKAAEALIELEAREARLLGLDMPTRIEASGRDGAPLTIAVARQIIAEAGEVVEDENGSGDSQQPD